MEQSQTRFRNPIINMNYCSFDYVAERGNSDDIKWREA